ncbi:MAG: hypothetical protein VSS75_023035, partial [Candidatus Parabeggiatoa sp.]|nr:hypothetical protein [Candidatus Parabeggiatoa sp.]
CNVGALYSFWLEFCCPRLSYQELRGFTYPTMTLFGDKPIKQQLCQLSVISYQLSVISYQLSDVMSFSSFLFFKILFFKTCLLLIVGIIMPWVSSLWRVSMPWISSNWRLSKL